jgi:CMP-N,N'-diacetyllegionaminic acid synthase
MENHRVLALITARAGSKRLPGKNLKMLGNRPLVMWTINAAKQSKYITDIIVSSDDHEILELCKAAECHVPFVRPDHLASDHSTSFDVAEHAILNLPQKYDWLMLLQPTSPFRRAEDIDQALEISFVKNYNSLISITESPVSYFMNLKVTKDNHLQTVAGINLKDLNNMRSQDMPKGYEINGAIYVVKIDWFLQNKIFFDEHSGYIIMDKERSVNIDTYHDWLLAEFYLKNNIHDHSAEEKSFI